MNLRKSLHYARANFPVDDAGMQPPMEALEAAGLRQMGQAGSTWDSPISESDEE